MTGETLDTDFPVTDGSAYGGGAFDAFVIKLDANGARVYSTYLGGSDLDEGRGIAVDAAGNAYVTGTTSSTNFPVTNSSTYGVGTSNGFATTDGFLTKLDTGGVRVYSTYFGADKGSGGKGIAVDVSGKAYVTGYTASTSFAVTDGSTYGGGELDGVVLKLDTGGVPG